MSVANNAKKLKMAEITMTAKTSIASPRPSNKIPRMMAHAIRKNGRIPEMNPPNLASSPPGSF